MNKPIKKDLESIIKYRFKLAIIFVRYSINQRFLRDARALAFTNSILDTFEFNYIEEGGFYTWDFILQDKSNYYSSKNDYLDTLLRLSEHHELIYFCLCNLYISNKEEIADMSTFNFVDYSMNYLNEFIDLIEYNLCPYNTKSL